MSYFETLSQKAGHRIAKKLVDGIYEEPFKIVNQPEIGQAEEILKGRDVEFRYLLYKKNYKIIYWINREENRIEINDVFDVREYPFKMKRNR